MHLCLNAFMAFTGVEADRKIEASSNSSTKILICSIVVSSSFSVFSVFSVFTYSSFLFLLLVFTFFIFFLSIIFFIVPCILPVAIKFLISFPI